MENWIGTIVDFLKIDVRTVMVEALTTLNAQPDGAVIVVVALAATAFYVLPVGWFLLFSRTSGVRKFIGVVFLGLTSWAGLAAFAGRRILGVLTAVAGVLLSVTVVLLSATVLFADKGHSDPGQW